jgi:hypothetical protein
MNVSAALTTQRCNNSVKKQLPYYRKVQRMSAIDGQTIRGWMQQPATQRLPK